MTRLPPLPFRFPTALTLSLAVTLAACGGGEPSAAVAPDAIVPDAARAAPAPTGVAGPDAGPSGMVPPADAAGFTDPPATLSRRFALEDAPATGDEPAPVIAEAAAAGERRLLVRLNPAAAVPVPLDAGTGDGAKPDPAWADPNDRPAALAAKARAVDALSQRLLDERVRKASGDARVVARFAHAVEAFVLSVPADQAQAVADALAADPAVDGVEPERTWRVGQTVGSRTLAPGAWGVDRIDQRASAFDNAFRSVLDGRGVSIYVVDTGVKAHEQFGSRLAAGYAGVPDGRGTTDCHGHGTHVAGIAAGATTGVAPGSRIVPVRVMGCTGSSSGSDLLGALDWIVAQGARPGVVNMSLGGPASDTLDAAVRRAVAAGFSVIVAAGNENADACGASPARVSEALGVGALDRGDTKAAYSNWGRCVGLWAPGTGIASAGISASNALVSFNGTSMAAPHVAGAAALLWQAAPTGTPTSVRQQLLARATPNLPLTVPSGSPRLVLYAGPDGAPTAPAPAPLTAVTVKSLTPSTLVPAVGAWQPRVAVRITTNAGTSVAGATVEGRFAHMPAPLRCTTAADGSCTLTGDAVPWATVSAVGFSMSTVSGATLSWAGTGSRTVSVTRPTAPVAGVTALTGTKQAVSGAAGAWRPVFAITVLDAQKVPVAGAVVATSMKVHAGTRVVGTQTAGCVTDAAGRCELAWLGPTLGSTQTGAVLSITGVTRTFLTYKAGLTTASVGSLR